MDLLFAIIQLNYGHTAKLAYGHIPIAITSPLGRMHTHYAANSTVNNANFVHKVRYNYMSQSIQIMITIKGPRLIIDPAHNTSLLTITSTETEVF